jgi:NADH-quinone oxidoreductase subunit L
MLMGLGAGSYFAGVFHLTTHAAFKCLLFLCSGVFIHHFSSNDMFEIAKAGGRNLKIPMIAITIAGAALSGIFPLAGFFSKEAVMGALAGLHNPIWVAAGLAGAFMTAYYTFRLLFVMWCPPAMDAAHGHDSHTHDKHGHDHHSHDSDALDSHGGHDSHGGGHSDTLYWVMCAPLVILSVFTLALGFGEHGLASFLLWGKLPEAGHHGWLLPAALSAVGCGVGLAWLEFGRKGAAQTGFLSKMPALETLFANRWYMDHFYRRVLDFVVYGFFSRIFTFNDRRMIDGGIDGFCRGTVGVGGILSRLQSSYLQYNLLTMLVVIAVLGMYFLLA